MPGEVLRLSLFRPEFADVGDDLIFVALQLADEFLIASFFVARGPKNHFGEDGREVDAFRSENVNQFSPVGGVGLRCDDAVFFQSSQAVGEDVGRDFLVRAKKFLVSFETPDHHVPQDQERPAVTQHLNRRIQRTRRPPFKSRLLRHAENIKYFTCI